MPETDVGKDRNDRVVFVGCLILLGIVWFNIVLPIGKPCHLQTKKEMTEAVIKDQSQLIQDCVKQLVHLEKDAVNCDHQAEFLRVRKDNDRASQMPGLPLNNTIFPEKQKPGLKRSDTVLS